MERCIVFYIGECIDFVEIIKVVDRVRPENTITTVDENDD